MDRKVKQLLSRAESLDARFEQERKRDQIDEAIILDRIALHLCLLSHATRSESLKQLSIHLSGRYKQFGQTTDMEEAVELAREALALSPPGHADRGMYLHNLGYCLSNRYEQSGMIADLNEAIVLGRDAVALFTPGHPDRSTCLNNLGMYFYSRHNQLGAIGDLDEAIILGRDALALRSPGHPGRLMCLNNLGSYLSSRYSQLGEIADLDKAIILGREVLALCPPGHPDCFMYMNNLGLRLSSRYNQLGAIADLDEAVVLGRDALALCPPGHTARSTCFNNLGSRLYSRYNQVGGIADLDQAIILGQEALALCPPAHPEHSMLLSNLGSCLSSRYNQLGEIVDLDEAIILGRRALTLHPRGHPNYSMYLNNLGNRLSSRYKRLGVVTDLDEAIVLVRNALTLCPLGHPLRSWSLKLLASCLKTRFTRSNQAEDMEEVFTVYSQILRNPPSVSSDDLDTARAWIGAAEDLGHPTIVLAYETTLRFLVHHLTTLPSLPQHLDLLKKHTSSLAVDAFSACLRDHLPMKAVELVEQGRGVFWCQLMRLHSPLDDVKASGSSGEILANKFIQITTDIRTALYSLREDQHDRIYSLNVALDAVASDIRKLPGLTRFLLPSLFSHLQTAASGGPVIIVNASKYGCDAVVIFFDRDPVHIRLEINRDRVREMVSELYRLTQQVKEEHSIARYFVIVLRELWEHVVSPIATFLQTVYPVQSRIWWCPTAEFTLLPLHAAGLYKTGQPKISDLYISSYTPTLTALIHARQQQSRNPPSRELHFVAIGQAKAAGERELHGIGDELTNVGQCVESCATFRRIQGPDSCIPQVAKGLIENEWVHLACHGIPNRKKPFDSAFALHDGRFTVERIIRCETQNAQFAYLSACHTTVGDEECPDEMIHLASAMHFIGFRSVIGTMWAVDDAEAKKITATFYDHMIDDSGRLDHTGAAHALHKTLWTLPGLSFDQRILYIHIGV